MNVYIDREQTEVKHFILRTYLQELAFKVLRTWDIAYIDGFSGPWESKSADFSDSSFMIAIQVLMDAQRVLLEQTGTLRRIKCFFSEKSAAAYGQMAAAVARFHRPSEGIEIRTFHGEFVDAVHEARHFIGNAFPLIFIDPTGWTGYPFTKIAPLFVPDRCEVLINFMYSFINRFLDHPDPNIIASLDPILGGPGWQSRLDPSLEPGPGVEKLFRDTLKTAGNFSYVVSTKVDRSTSERPHFFLAYGTKNRAGLKAFRDTEYRALRSHARRRSEAMSRKRESQAGAGLLFPEFDADQQEASIDTLVAEQMVLAKELLLDLLLVKGAQPFTTVVDTLLQRLVLRETNVKDICVELARNGKLQNSWGGGVRKPNDQTIIYLV